MPNRPADPAAPATPQGTPLRVALLSRYSRLGASSRIRALQYIAPLAQAGIEILPEPLFDDRYLERLYAGKPSRLSVARAFARRLGQLRRTAGVDLIWLEKEALPWLPWKLERALLPRGIPVVSDFDDAVFHRYDGHRSALVRRLLGDKIDRIMAHSAMVFAGNDYLAARARQAGAPRVEIVPTVVDTDAYAVVQPLRPDAAPVIGWIGTPSTWDAYTAPMLPMLREVAAGHGGRLRVVGAGSVAPDPLIDNLPWSEAAEVGLIQSMDLGIMPLEDTPWARGKCGYKLIQYMACGLPVVASPVGVNARIVEHGVNGFLASSEAEWRAALSTLLADPDLRRRMGQAGRAKVEADYSLSVWAPRVAALLRALAGRAPTDTGGAA